MSEIAASPADLAPADSSIQSVDERARFELFLADKTRVRAVMDEVKRRVAESVARTGKSSADPGA